MKKLLLISLAILLVSGLVCNAYAQSASKPKYGGIMSHVIYPRAPKHLGEPLKLWGVDAGNSYAMLEGLIRTDLEKDGTFLYRPVLATSWKLLPDGKSLEFTLRKGVKFHDGTDFNAAAVKYNHDIIREKHGAAMTTVTSIDVVDDYTVRYNLSKPDSLFLSNLCEGFAQVISPTAKEKNGAKWARENPVGTGAFKFVSYKRNVKLVMEKFDDYWEKGIPYVDGLEYNFVKESLVAQAAFEKGDVFAFYRFDSRSAVALKRKGYAIKEMPANLRLITFDSKNPDSFFADKKVREAVEYALDRKAYCDMLTYGYDEPLNQIAPSASYAYDHPLKGREYNPEKARKLLAEAGHPNGFQTQFFGQRQHKDLWTAVQGDLAKVGIQVKLSIVTHARLQELRYKGGLPKTSMLSWGVSNRADYVISINNLLSSASGKLPEQHRAPGLDSLFHAAINAGNFAEKKANTQAAVRAIQEDAMVIPIWNHKFFAVTQKYVHGAKYMWPDAEHSTYKYTWIDK